MAGKKPTPNLKPRQELRDFLHSWAHRHAFVTETCPIFFCIANDTFQAEGVIGYDGSPFDLTLDDWEKIFPYAVRIPTRNALEYIQMHRNTPFTARDIGGREILKQLRLLLADAGRYVVATVGDNKCGKFPTYRLKRVYRFT